MPADRGLVGRILLRGRAPAPLMEALTTRTQSADSVTIVTENRQSMSDLGGGLNRSTQHFILKERWSVPGPSYIQCEQ
jgi:hypothetical protein